MRQRRLRATPAIRESHVEVRFTKDQLVYPLFIIEKENYTKEISSMPGIFQFSPDQVANEVAYLVDKGIQNFILFGIPNTKDFEGKEAANPKGPVCTATRLLKDNFGKSITLYADVCLCEYTTHGHCGIPDSKGTIQNDSSLPVLANAAVAYAEAGADWVAPSNMMDERVISIREQLDLAGLSDIRILSYAAKYASSYYGPFRDAAESPPEFGDRKSYQIDFRTIQQGLNEIQNDEMQGAD
ncbi:MAG: porphobilinogen synthase, partial [Candidatus Heimdallarchaeota archaeon]|nr:porphobilinogen synthase [Candidatus Heimdallarchaeota archaeon]